MKTNLFVLFIGFCVLCSPAGAAVSLKVNGTDYETLSLRVGQTVQIEIYSDDAALYEAYLGFDSGTPALGALSNPESYKPAGTAAYFQSVTPPTVPLKGYYVMAAGTGRKAGLHFSFTYTPATVGQTTLKLYDSTIATVLDSIVMNIEAAETGTGFTYQGRLLEDNQAATGPYDMVFTLFDAPGEGGIIGAPVTLNNVDVVDGYFVSVLDFGSTAYGAEARWLQTSVRPSGSADDYTLLWPRQRITPAPQATYASGVDWANIAGIPAGLANYTAPNIAAGYVPYYDGTRLVSSSLSQSGGNISLSGILNPASNLQIATEAGAHVAIGTGISSSRKLNVYTDTDMYAIYGEAARTSGSNTGLYGRASGNTTSNSFGVYGNSSSDSGINFGVVGQATNTSSGTNYGVYGQASNSGAGNAFAGYFAGDTRITGNTAIGTTIDTDRKLNVYTSTNNYAVYGQAARSTGSNYGLFGHASGNSTIGYGVYGTSSNDLGINYGVSGQATTASSGTNYGVYGWAFNSGTGEAFAGYFVGDTRIYGRLNHNFDLQIATQAGAEVAIGTTINTDSKLTVYTNANTYAVYGEAANSSGDNYGLFGRARGTSSTIGYGVYGTSSNDLGSNVGVRGQATNASSGTNYGVYGSASNSGSGNAWAGYFVGDVYASDNVGIGTTSIPSGRRINTDTGAYLTTGGAWTNASSRQRKENFEAVDGRQVLERLVRVPVSTWNYKTEDASVRHMGPVSQDLYAAFQLSGDDETISTVDTAGISIAAIQGLYQIIEEKDAEIAMVRQESEHIRNRLSASEARLAALEELLLSGENTAKGAE